jgi:hypothetical protein
LGSWVALSTDSRKPAPQAAAPAARPAPSTSAPATPTATKLRVPDVTKPDVPKPRPCADRQAGMPGRAGKISRLAGDFDGDNARDQLLAYAELDAAGQPGQWHVRVVLATGGSADLAVSSGDWISPNGLVARRAVDANNDGRDEGFVTSTGGASNDAYNIFVLADCQVRQVRVTGAGGFQLLVGASAGHAEGFDCHGTDRRGRRLLTLWSVERADQQPDGGFAYTYTKVTYRWVGNTLVRLVDIDHGGFAIVAGSLPVATSDQGRDQLPAEFTTRCGGGSW